MKPRRLRSFVRRDSRRTDTQKEAYDRLWPYFGLSPDKFDCQQVFGRKAPCYLEIGFGSGQSLFALAKLHPEINFIGIETYKSGIGTLFMEIETAELTNVRVYDGDAVDFFQNCLHDATLDRVQIFFPDPWQKRRHHARRLIQSEFVQLLIQKSKRGAELHLATDWQDYAMHMMKVLSSDRSLSNMAGEAQFAERSNGRPVITKFEQRAKKEGRSTWELQFAIISCE